MYFCRRLTAEQKALIFAYAELDKDKIKQHLEYLTNLYAFIDSQESTGIGITRFNQLNQETGVERISKKLKEFTYSQGIDWELVAKISAYITRVLPKTETRFTHGDLQPGNIMLTDNGQTYLIDFAQQLAQRIK